MHVIVVGAGVIGASTAYYLARDGHRVTLLDRNAGAALDASFANGGQLSYRYVAPLAGPGVLAKLPGWLLRADAPVRFRPRPDPAQWRWCLRFAAHCNARDSDATSARLLALGRASRRLLGELIADEPALAFAHARSGKLVVHRDAGALEAARRQLALQARLDDAAGLDGPPQRLLDAAACIAVEPALAALADRLAGGVYTPDEEVGDCHLFTRGLVDRLASLPGGHRTMFGTPVRALVGRAGAVRGIDTGDGVIDADAVVLATGVDAPALVAPLGVALPVQPVKGHSLDAPILQNGAAPRISVTDLARKTVYARIGDRLRVAGFADVVGADRRVDAGRVRALLAETAAAFPGAIDPRQARAWAGLRPATPDGRPILGAAPVDGLWLNVGHGALGFTLALGSARALADRIAGRASSVSIDGFGLPDARAPGRRSLVARPRAA